MTRKATVRVSAQRVRRGCSESSLVNIYDLLGAKEPH
jgi:hypothetical protein